MIKIGRLIIILLVLVMSSGCLTGNLVNDKYYLNAYGNLTPAKTNTYYVGNPTYMWANGYFTNLTTNTLNLFNSNTQISRNGAGDMIFIDAISGTKTLAQLAIGSGGNVTGTGTLGRISQWTGANTIGDATNTDAQVSAAITATHTQNTDTALTTNGAETFIVGNATTHNALLTQDLKTDRWITGSNFNTFLGVNVAGRDNLTAGGLDNTAIGYSAMYEINSGFGNTAMGNDALRDVSTGYYNTAVGNDALDDVSSGTNNTGIGELAAGTVSTGSFNTAVGSQALLHNNGNYNTAFGQWAGSNNTGNSNLFLGYSAGQDSLAVSNKLYVDNSNTPTPLIYGDFATNNLTVNGSLDVTGGYQSNTLAGVSGNYTFYTGATEGMVKTITISGGIITAVYLEP